MNDSKMLLQRIRLIPEKLRALIFFGILFDQNNIEEVLKIDDRLNIDIFNLIHDLISLDNDILYPLAISFLRDSIRKV